MKNKIKVGMMGCLMMAMILTGLALEIEAAETNYYQLDGFYSFNYPEEVTNIQEKVSSGVADSIDYQFAEVLHRLEEKGVAEEKLEQHQQIFAELKKADKTYTVNLSGAKFTASAYALEIKDLALTPEDFKLQNLPAVEQISGTVDVQEVEALGDMRTMLGDMEDIKYDLKVKMKNASLAGQPANRYQLQMKYKVTEGLTIVTTSQMLLTTYQGDIYYLVFNNNGLNDEEFAARIAQITDSFTWK